MNPLEQLNLMLWLAWAPQGLFVQQGFELHAIGAQLYLDPALQRFLMQANPKWKKQAVAPDLLLRHAAEGHWRMLECKKSSFSPNSSDNAAQAAAMLVLTPRWFAQARAVLEEQVAQVEVCYALNAGHEEAQQATLEEVSRRLQSQGMATNPAGAFGIYRESTVLLKGAPQAPCCWPPRKVDLPPEGVYPLLPVDPSVDAKNPEGWKDLQERLRSGLVAWMGKHLSSAVDQPIVLHLEDDLLRRAILVWDVWEDEGRKNVYRRARAFVRELLHPVHKYFHRIQEHPTGWTFQVPDLATVNSILKHLLSAESRRREMPAQLSLFDVSPSGEEKE